MRKEVRKCKVLISPEHNISCIEKTIALLHFHWLQGSYKNQYWRRYKLHLTWLCKLGQALQRIRSHVPFHKDSSYHFWLFISLLVLALSQVTRILQDPVSSLSGKYCLLSNVTAPVSTDCFTTDCSQTRNFSFLSWRWFLPPSQTARLNP